MQSGYFTDLRKLVVVSLSVLTLMVPTTAWSRYARPEIEDIPVDRLAANLTAKAKELEAGGKEQFKKAAKLFLNSARAHAMAFSLKTESAKARRGRNELGAWFGYEPKHVPFSVKETDDAEKNAAAKQHLAQAIAAYDIELNPDDFTARLGRAWCTDQAGQKEQSTKLYREIIQDAWDVERKLTRAGLGWHSVVAETAAYLTPMLDRTKDAAELQELQNRIARVRRIPRPVTPIIIPLKDNVPLERLLDEAAAVSFDADGTGLKKDWTWINPQAAWLVRDPRRTGRVDSALQMFGNVSFWMFWDNGYDALAALDDDANGSITGAELHGLSLWHDRNCNGVSEAGEVRPVEDWGIVALSCRYSFARDKDKTPYASQGVTFKGGSIRPTHDVILHEASGSSVDRR